MVLEKKQQNAIEHRLFRRLQGRERLLSLAAAARQSTVDNPELERLKVYLLDWAMSHRAIDSGRVERGGSNLAQYMKSESQTSSELLGGSNAWALGVITSSVDDLLKLPRGSEMRSALCVRYLNEGISKDAGFKVSVLRSGRLQHISLMEADQLADAAELALIPLVKGRNLPL